MSNGWVRSRIPSLSTVEAEYIAAGSCYIQLLLDYGICQTHLTIYCDNTSATNISKNPIQHHFIRELIEDGILTPEFMHTDDQKADLFIKPLDLNSCTKTLVLSLWSDPLFFFFQASTLLVFYALFIYLFVFMLCFKFFFLNKKMENFEKYKNSVCLYILVLVWLGWPLKQNFLTLYLL